MHSRKIKYSIISACWAVGCLKFIFSANRLELPPKAFRVSVFANYGGDENIFWRTISPSFPPN
jgi:hypothetical protein